MGFITKRKKNFLLNFAFKPGRPGPAKGKKHHFEKRSNSYKYVRLERSSFEARVAFNENILTFRDVDGSQTQAKPLRPRANGIRYVNMLRVPASSKVHPDLLTNTVYVPALLQSMMSSENKKHRLRSDKCKGDLVIDGSASVKWGLGWRERLLCTRCKYVGKHYKLYNEVQSSTRGRKAAQINVGSQIGVASTSIGNTGFLRILNTTYIIAPSPLAMQKQANKVNTAMKSLNERSMCDIRKNLVAENAKIGQQDPTLVNVEGDTCYNNPIFKSDAIPFQAGTIAISTMCENNTKNKQNVGVLVSNKLCRTSSMLRNKGQPVQCPNHRGHCTANVSERESIGDKGKYNEVLGDLISHDIKISNFTCDGDSRAIQGVRKSHGHNVGHLRDLRHLGNSLKRELNKAPFSKGMLKGHSKCNIRSRFALSVKARCIAELKAARKKLQGDIITLKKVMVNVISTIILCFNGYCGTSCAKYSYVCAGTNRQAKKFMPHNVKVKMVDSDQHVLRKCLEMVLGPAALDATKLLTTTQKCEAANRSYQAVNPKSVTFSRNCVGRIHGQVYKLNNGYANSVIAKTMELHANLTQGSKVIKQLAYEDRNDLNRKRTSATIKARALRARTRNYRYKLHEELHYGKGISDPKPDFEGLPHLKHHKYA
ncbi:hypothetical protein DPMN_175128 [Dreissena polymorpha]|uniref:Mutator-like transposase domain-containing protein n=3 Tax=Dreissena polymorpha TaxID=45954 RepID=A0A9D4E7K8_DREPO|nr:hypothetical protein DPMN_175127 [Dreissena polymorpha]KAH3773760.1 hypothetical protein DPMN_175128 [Dreissena polymorpha]